MAQPPPFQIKRSSQAGSTPAVPHHECEEKRRGVAALDSWREGVRPIGNAPTTTILHCSSLWQSGCKGHTLPTPGEVFFQFQLTKHGTVVFLTFSLCSCSCSWNPSYPVQSTHLFVATTTTTTTSPRVREIKASCNGRMCYPKHEIAHLPEDTKSLYEVLRLLPLAPRRLCPHGPAARQAHAKAQVQARYATLPLRFPSPEPRP